MDKPLFVVDIHIADYDSSNVVIELFKLFLELSHRSYVTLAGRAIPDTKEDWANVSMKSVPAELKQSGFLDEDDFVAHVLPSKKCDSAPTFLVRSTPSRNEDVPRQSRMLGCISQMAFSQSYKFWKIVQLQQRIN